MKWFKTDYEDYVYEETIIKDGFGNFLKYEYRIKIARYGLFGIKYYFTFYDICSEMDGSWHEDVISNTIDGIEKKYKEFNDDRISRKQYKAKKIIYKSDI